MISIMPKLFRLKFTMTFLIIFIYNGQCFSKDHLFLNTDIGDPDDKCDAGKVLEIAMHDSGVNLARKVDTGFLGKKTISWECPNIKIGPDGRYHNVKNNPCPPMDSSQITCYSNSITGIPALCLDGESTQKVGELTFPRFKKVTVLKEVAMKNYGEKINPTFLASNWELEGSCNVSKANLTDHKSVSTKYDLDSCLEAMHRLMICGEIPSPYSKKQKYCSEGATKNKAIVDEIFNAVDYVVGCKKAFPNLKKQYVMNDVSNEKTEENNSGNDE